MATPFFLLTTKTFPSTLINKKSFHSVKFSTNSSEITQVQELRHVSYGNIKVPLPFRT